MSKVLFIAYHYFPEQGSCADKNRRIARLLVRAGYDIIIITKNAGESNIEMIEGKNVPIIRTPNGAFHRDAVQSEMKQHSVFSKRSKYANFCKRLKKWLSLKVIPDGAIDWLRIALRTIKNNHILKDVDVIVSASSPYTSHVLAYRLWKRKKIPYILTYGDPWIYEPKRKRGRLRLMIEKAIEGSIIKHSFKVFLITEFNRCHYMEMYNLPAEKVGTYHIGCEPVKEIVKTKIPRTYSTFVYGGSLDPVHRNPSPFLIALQSLNGIKIDIYNDDYDGLRNEVNDLKLNDRVKVYAQVPSLDFEKKMQLADGLILFGNKTPFQVPGKLFNYIATGKHIIYIKNNDAKNDETLAILEEYGNYSVVPNEANAIAECLAKLTKSELSWVDVEKINNFAYTATMAPIAFAIDNAIRSIK